MAKFERIELIDGNYSYIGEPPLCNFHLINLYHEDMQSVLSGKPVWHPDTVIDGKSIIDTNLDLIKLFIPKISALFRPEVPYRQMTKRSLYQFFVCSAPIEHEGAMIGGLSGLRVLLGHDIASKEVAPSISKPKHTTGDIVADITAAILLSFEGGGMELLNYPLSFCVNVLKQASELSKTDADKKEANLIQNAIRRQKANKEKQDLQDLTQQQVDLSSIPDDIKALMPDC